ncbi:glycosyltransferase family 4 protein [Solirubrobacter sp. CPCC 204708]|uniref:Glycosyltransferase family 4 protein n=1 Tax=Solirubrobacter deserti TaxID=2282478 RepID=A0ABT4RIF3_9ACTN|nr:glycosyltransferase family 4 protein [Solirubrobacter deserti]MBE2320289.1 glycosyltransferase family 4 protein [Solirubrobacter deserti]MDA0138324.1 glycosyltransferase family 4 protein [Solirubrobacter deserti]
MRILVFHGYLLHGTGSNIYNAELGAALVRGGHELHLLCQESDPYSLPWVDATGDWDSGELQVQARRQPARATVYRPDIAGVLPLYVADHYAGFDARPFPQLSDEEVERYIELNVRAVRDVVERAQPEVALANHLVMGPVILARALNGAVPYAVKVHGSDLTYVVNPYPRFRPAAAEGAEKARGLLVGSRHTGEVLWDQLGHELAERTRLGPPGVDVERFGPDQGDLAGLRARLEQTAPTEGSSFARDPREAVAALDAIEPGDRLIVFVGKLIASKGVELLLAAFPAVLAREPRARLLIVGFGAFRERLEQFVAQLDAGDRSELRGEDGRELPQLAAFMNDAELPDARIADRVHFAGRLDHDELTALLPAAEAMAVPSTTPEAFGMVAAEAAACGALPVVADHSGLGEVARTLREAVPEEARGWLSFELGDQSVTQLADALSGWLAAPEDLRERTREAIVAVTRERYSWDGVARTVIAAGRGELDDLPRV